MGGVMLTGITADIAHLLVILGNTLLWRIEATWMRKTDDDRYRSSSWSSQCFSATMFVFNHDNQSALETRSAHQLHSLARSQIITCSKKQRNEEITGASSLGPDSFKQTLGCYSLRFYDWNSNIVKSRDRSTRSEVFGVKRRSCQKRSPSPSCSSRADLRVKVQYHRQMWI